MIAARELQADIGSHGVPMSVATDPANEYRFHVPNPTVDWAERAIEVKKKTYYAAYPDADKSGHLWRVQLELE